MVLLSNKDLELKNDNGSKKPKRQSYQLANAKMTPHDDNQPRISEESTKSQHIRDEISEVDDFDLLEPFLVGNGQSFKPDKLETYKNEFDLLEIALFSAPISNPLRKPENNLDPIETPLNSIGEPTQADQHLALENIETTKLVQSLLKNMTLGQKMKFLRWFNSGLSIKEAAKNSKIPNLVPPPVRHRDCKFSKRSLRRLSRLLPNEYLQRQFVHETYSAGVDPKQLMRYLLMGVGSENLVATFECQFALEEYASTNNILRKTKCNMAAIATTDPIIPTDNVERLPEPDLQATAEDNYDIISSSPNRLHSNERTYYFWRHIGLSINEASSMAEIHNGQDIVPHPDCCLSWEQLLEMANTLPDQTTKELFLVNVYFDGKLPSEVLKNLFVENVNQPLEPNQAEHSRLELDDKFMIENSRASSMSGERNLTSDNPNRIEFSLGGSTPMRISDSNQLSSEDNAYVSDNQSLRATNSPQLTLRQLKKYYLWCNQGFSHNEALVKAKTPGLEPESVAHPRCKLSIEDVNEMSKAISVKESRLIFQIEVFYGGKNPEDVLEMILSSYKKLVPTFFDEKVACDPSVAIDHTELGSVNDDLTEESIISEMNAEQLKKYYKWRRLGASFSEASSKSKIPGLNPTVEGPHPDCKHSIDEVKKISSALPSRQAQYRFQIEVFYGGKDPFKLLNREKGHRKPLSPRVETGTKDNNSGETRSSKSDLKHVNPNETDFTAKSHHEALLHLNCQQLRTYYVRQKAGHSHNDALKKATRESGVQKNKKLVVAHPSCKHSKVQLVQKSLILPEQWMRDRFMVHTFFGGMDPDYAAKLLQSASVKESQLQIVDEEQRQDVRRNERVDNADELQMTDDSVILLDSPVATIDLTDSPSNENASSKGTEVLSIIVPVNFPDEILTESQMDAIQNNILEAILEIDDGPSPRFENTFRSSGRYGILCNDEFSAQWLSKYLTRYMPWKGATLRLMTIKSTNLRASAVLPPSKNDGTGKILRYIGKQNVGLVVSKWIVLERVDTSDNTLLDFIVDEESAKVLLKSSRISFKLGSGDIKIVSMVSSSDAHSSNDASAVSASPLPPSTLGALLKISPAGSRQEQPLKSSVNSPVESSHSDCQIVESPENRRKIRSEGKDRKRFRSSTDSYSRSPSRDSHRERASKKRHLRRASRSPSRERRYSRSSEKLPSSSKRAEELSFDKALEKLKKSASDMSPNRGRARNGNDSKTIPSSTNGSRNHPVDEALQNLKAISSPCSNISSDSHLSILLDGPHRSRGSPSIENTEYSEYLGT